MSADTKFTMTINGKAVTGAEKFGVENPATAEVFAEAPNCTQAELDEAVAAARAALPAWRKTPIEKRKEVMLAIAGVIGQNGEELARLLTQEQGKPFEPAMGDVLGGAHWFAETAKLDIPEVVSQDDEERYTVTRFEPIGVVAAIVPWNFPIILAAFGASRVRGRVGLPSARRDRAAGIHSSITPSRSL